MVIFGGGRWGWLFASNWVCVCCFCVWMTRKICCWVVFVFLFLLEISLCSCLVDKKGQENARKFGHVFLRGSIVQFSGQPCSSGEEHEE